MGSEINRVLSETEVGRPLLEALDAMARRLDVQDLDWTVEGIRIQSEVGGRLSEMDRGAEPPPGPEQKKVAGSKKPAKSKKPKGDDASKPKGDDAS